MAPLAPIVIRSGDVIAHVNDLAALDQILASLRRASPPARAAESATTAALLAYEDA